VIFGWCVILRGWSCRPLWLNKSTFVMMRPAIRKEVLMADGPEMYRLYVECRNCKHEIALKKAWGPKPDRPPLTALAVQLTWPSCNFEAFYPPADMRVGILTQMSNITSAPPLFAFASRRIAKRAHSRDYSSPLRMDN